MLHPEFPLSLIHILIENAGLDTINLIAELKAAHEDSSKIGINVFTGKLVDMRCV